MVWGGGVGRGEGWNRGEGAGVREDRRVSDIV